MHTNPWPSDWMRATLSLCVLKALDGGATYGYAIAARLEEEGFGNVKGGTLYPLLTRCEAAGWVTTAWRAGDGGPGRKYFSLTSEGRRELEEQRELWDRFTGTVDGFLSNTAGRIPVDDRTPEIDRTPDNDRIPEGGTNGNP